MRHRGDVAIDVGDHRLRREAAAMAASSDWIRVVREAPVGWWLTHLTG
jgi:hypothetical protein